MPPDSSSSPSALDAERPALGVNGIPRRTADPGAPTTHSDAQPTTTEVPGAEGGMFATLKTYPAYRRLWFGSQGASIGQWMQAVGLGWLALELTNSESFVGMVTFMAGLPFVLLAIPSGYLVDRFDRRRLILACQGASAIVAVIMAMNVVSGVVQPWHLLLAAIANGSLMALLTPTQQSLVPNLVPRHALTNAIGLNSAGMNLSRVIGPSLAGALIGFFGTSAAFVLQAVALIIAYAIVSGITLPARLSSPATNPKAIFEGVTLIARRPDLRGLFLLACIPTLFVFPYISFLNVFARDILNIGPQGLGILMAMSGGGAVVGSLAVASRKKMTGMGTSLVVMTAVYGVFVVGIAVSREVWLTLPLLFIAGVLGAAYMSANNALLQLQIADEVRGRVTSAYMLTFGLMPLGALPMGLAAARIGTPTAVAIGAITSSLLAVLLGLTNREFRRL